LPGSPEGPLFSSETKLGAGAAWDITRGGNSDSDRVERMDLRTGGAGIWYAAPPGHAVFILGFDDNGHPVLALYPRDASSTKALLLLTGPNQTTKIWDDSAGTARFATAFGDAHGIWIGSSGSL